MMENGDIIHVVLAVHDPKGTYSRHAAVVMVTIFERTSSPVCVHILHDETLTELNRGRLSETAESFGQNVEFHDVSSYVRAIAGDMAEILRNWSIGIIFKLFTPDVLTLDKIICLDCDILVNLDIRELWDIPLDGCSVAGVSNALCRGRFSAAAFRKRLMGLDWQKSIGAGVLVMDLSRIRAGHNFIAELVSWIERYKHCADAIDEEFILHCFLNDIKVIAEKFNSDAAYGISDRIIHTFGKRKLWDVRDGSELEHIYWRTCLKTAWGSSAADVVDLMIDTSKTSPFMHRRTSRCYARILDRLRMDILRRVLHVIEIIRLGLIDLRLRRSLSPARGPRKTADGSDNPGK
ncbi:MAG: hypothetical protein LBT23_04825 [Synergistaceae bacterium]|jgi:lipopolysaccharide biosynthesis glycosyltransferase|nr:hypothetical protein [Synergistaceae bacterium]